MTLRVAIDNTNVASLPVGNLRDIAGMARRFADDMESSRYGEVLRTVTIVQNEGGHLAILGWGEGTTAFELMGVFEAAKLRVFADDVIED